MANNFKGIYLTTSANLPNVVLQDNSLTILTDTGEAYFGSLKLTSGAFIINGSVSDTGVITFTSLNVANLISAINSNTIVIFKPSSATYPSVILSSKVSGTTYTLTGSVAINETSNITNYECMITIVDNVADGTYTAKQPSIPIATSSVLGGVKGGADGTSIDANGVISFKPIIPVATLADLPALNQTNYDKHLFYMPSDGFNLRYMAKELGVWQLSTTSLASSEYCGIAYGNGKFVVVSDTGTSNAYYSTDGNTWNPCTGISGILYSVAYGNNRFVAVGEETAFYSSDGISWTAITTTDIFLGIAYGNGRFIAVGKVVKALADGATTWTSITSAISGTDLNSVCYDTDRFIIVGQTAKSQYLLNGSTTCVLMTGNIGTDDLYSVAYNSTRFVAVGANGRSIQSTNGTSWQNMGNNGLSSQSYYSIIPYGTRFLCLGANGSLYELIQGSNVWGTLTNSLSSTTGEDASLCYNNAIIIASYGSTTSTKVEYNTAETFVWRVNTSI